MNEQQLKDFGAHAETLVDLPDFAELDRKGHGLRVRRRVGIAGALAMVLTIAGVLTQIQHHPTNNEPIQLPKIQSDARPYRTQGRALDEGTYWLRPSLLDSRLMAEFTVPPGWDGSWIGPQHSRDGRHKSWYTNVLVLELDRVSSHGCMPDVELLETPDAVVDALSHAWSYELVQAPTAEHRFGFPATRMRLRVTKDAKVCPDTANATFHDTKNGYIPFAPRGALLDLWVVEVDGRAIFVQRAHTPNTPPGALADLYAVTASIRFGTR